MKCEGKTFDFLKYLFKIGITGLDDQVNSYLMYLLSCLAEAIGYLSCHLNDKFGRKKMLMFFLVSASVVCLIVAMLPYSSASEPSSLNLIGILKISFASIGKAMASAAFNSAYVYNSLLYPTSV
jgi:MFS family permease